MVKTKIARIDSHTRVVLADGSRSGVEVGMEFVIYELGEEIFDPETGDSLGQIEHVKGRVVVTHVQERMSFAETKEEKVTVGLPSYIAMFETEIIKKRKLKLKESPKSITPPNSLEVVVGDLARSV